MAQGARVHVEGNATGDAVLSFAQSGTAVVKFSVAATPRRMNRQTNEWEDGKTTFLNCVAFGNSAEHIAESVKRGTPVVVEGRLEQDDYTDKSGAQRTGFSCLVDSVGISPRRAPVTERQAQRPPQQSAPAQDPWATPPQVQGGAPPQGVQPQQGYQQGPPQQQYASYDEPPF